MRSMVNTFCREPGWCDVELVSNGFINADGGSRFSRLKPFWCPDGGTEQLLLHFHQPQRAATPGQAVVLYGPVLVGTAEDQGDPLCPQGPLLGHTTPVLAAAVITNSGPTLYEQNIELMDALCM